MVDESGREPWPAWSRRQGYEALAKYVSVETIRGLDLVEPGATASQVAGVSLDRNRTQAKRLYERLRRKGYAYQLEPWAPEGQRIRHAGWIDQSGGTCLDFAVLYATMCAEAGLAPLLAVRQDGTTGVHHAFVVVDLRRGWENRATVLPDVPQGVAQFEGSLPPALDDAVGYDNLLAIDCTCATRSLDEASGRGDAAEFEAAVREGRSLADRFATLTVVDVLYLQQHGQEPLPPPPKATPVISRFLPPFPEFTPYPSRATLEQKVRDARGRWVLCGAQGTGKSMLAHHIAASRADGCGWFLAASDASTLITSLAMVHAHENGLPTEGLTDADRREYAATAVSYLNEAPEPWAVVLDNANGEPAELGPWMPTPSRERRQLLVVTTTNDDWQNAPNTHFERVKGLSDADVLAEVGAAELVPLAQGRPLLSKSFAKLIAEAGTGALATPAGALDSPTNPPEVTAADGPHLLWRAARDHVEPDAVQTAWLLAWLPPDEIPVDLMGSLRDGADARVGALEEVGLVSYRASDTGAAGPPAISIHRLYVDAIRSDLRGRDEERHRSAVTVLEHPQAFEHLDQNGDQATIERIVTEVTEDYVRATEAGGDLASAVRYAARLQELHGQIGASSHTYDTVAERLLHELAIDHEAVTAAPDATAALPGAEVDQDVLAECLHGRARGLFQRARHDEQALHRALADCRLAITLRELADDKLGAARTQALAGLIQREQARFLDGEAERRALVEALEVIKASADERRALLGDRHPEVARSIFNLGGMRLQLAKTDGPDRVQEHLDHAEAAYRESYDIRLDIYRRKKKHPHIAACRNGLALVAYYRAILQPDLDDGGRVICLRDATGDAVEALRVRAELDGSRDGSDSVKSAALLAKILLARYELASTPGLAADVAEEAAAEVSTMAWVRAAGRS